MLKSGVGVRKSTKFIALILPKTVIKYLARSLLMASRKVWLRCNFV